MPSSFERSFVKQVFAGAIFIALVLGIPIALKWPASAPQPTDGIVVALEYLAAPKLAGGSRPVASVRLNNGQQVVANVSPDVRIAQGDNVHLLRIERLLSPTVFVIVAKVSSH